MSFLYNYFFKKKSEPPDGTAFLYSKTPLIIKKLSWFFVFYRYQMVKIPLGIVNYLMSFLFYQTFITQFDVSPLPDVKNEVIYKKPAVFVHGILGYGDKSVLIPQYWKDVRNVFINAFIPNNLGIGSARDRAIDLYYQIKGGRTDFGEEHSKKCGHDRYGNTYLGYFSQWNEDHPLPMIGHSMGAKVINELQYLLCNNLIPGVNIKNGHKWISCIISTAGAHGGVPYLISWGAGTSIENSKKPYPYFSKLWIIVILLVLYHKYIPKIIRKYIYDLQLEMWHLEKLSFFQVFSPEYNKLLYSNDTSPQSFIMEQAGQDCEKIRQMFDKIDDQIKISFNNTFDMPMDNRGLIRWPDPQCSIVCGLFPNDVGTFKGDGAQKPKMYKNAEWIYQDWLISDGIAPLAGQKIPCNNKEELLYSVYDYDKQEFTFKNDALYIYDHKFDHINVTGALNPNIDRTRFFQVMGKILHAVNKYRKERNLPYKIPSKYMETINIKCLVV
jgi:hypothetical protein